MRWTHGNSLRRLGIGAIALGMWLGVAPAADAAPISITSVLTGDPRPGNPDDLNVVVDIEADTTSNVSYWTVDLQMDADHADAALKQFYFNLLGDSSLYLVSNFSPDSWNVSSGDNAQGSGSADFMFETSGPNNTVTNSTNLTFTVTNLTGNFTLADFLDAEESCSEDDILGCAQLGAHIGSLTPANGESDSGFAMGGYDGDGTATQVPEPVSLTLFGLGLAAAVAGRRRKTGI